MTTLAEHNLAELPEWIRFTEPAEAHHAAFAAWLHVRTRCVLVKFWIADPYLCIAGAWVFEVRHPDGRRRDAWVAAVREPTCEEAVLQSADLVVKQLVVESVQQARE